MRIEERLERLVERDGANIRALISENHARSRPNLEGGAE